MREDSRACGTWWHRAGRLTPTSLCPVAREPEAQSGRQPQAHRPVLSSPSRPRAPGSLGPWRRPSTRVRRRSAHAVVDADEALVAEAINNPLDNALSGIARRAHASRSRCGHARADGDRGGHGRGILREERAARAALYRGRIMRAAAARGLGLAIANEIARARGRVLDHGCAGRRCAVEMRLPPRNLRH